MAFIPVPNGVQLCFDFASSGQNWQFCLMLRKSSGAPTTTDLEDVVLAAATWWGSSLKPDLTTATTLRQIRATDMTVQGGPQHIDTINQAGTSASDEIGLNSPLVVSLRTQKRGRSYRGRVYISGMNIDGISNAVDVASGTASAFATIFAGLATALDALGFDVVVASRQHNGVPTNPAEVNEVTAYIVDTHLDSQRRRLSGRGT